MTFPPRPLLNPRQMPFSEPSRKLAYNQEYRFRRAKTHRRVELSFTREEADLLTRYAKREGVSMAHLVKRLTLAQVDDRLYVPRVFSDALGRLSRLIGSMSTNVNQIAHAANRDAQFNRDIEARRLLQSIHQGHQEMRSTLRKEFDALWKLFQNDH